MSPRGRHASSVVLSVFLIAGMCYGMFVAVSATMHVLASINSGVVVAIIAASATVLVSVLSVVLGKFYEARSLIQKEHREKKIPVYEELIRFMSRILMSSKVGDPISDQEMIEFMSGFTQRAMVWASDDVLATWVKWRRLSLDQASVKTAPLSAMLQYEELIFAIRRDLGHKNKTLVSGDILALFVNDIDQYLPRKHS
jgi:hypothetical protein